jgi:GTP-binding protein
MFVDEAKIFVKGGRGGNGCVSFLREKYRPYGGPDGGDGGKGGDVILLADGNLHTLIDLTYHPHIHAGNGAHGRGKNQFGRTAPDKVLRVPPGTVVKDAEGNILADLMRPGQSYVAARGGRGGRGNTRFKSSIQRAPSQAEPGEATEERELLLELKLLADVGVVGLPNAGKSSLIARISAAQPKVASYPFTTLTPQLGMVRTNVDRSLVVADLPGVVEGASGGKGLGLRFLRHIERTKMLVQMMDIASPFEGSPVDDYTCVTKELASYRVDLSTKPRIIAANKMDLPEARANLASCRNWLERQGHAVYPISALTGEGVPILVEAIDKTLREVGAEDDAVPEV